jgi:hypothetical protein
MIGLDAQARKARLVFAGLAISPATDHISPGGSAASGQAELQVHLFARGLCDVGVAGKAQSPKTGSVSLSRAWTTVRLEGS